MNRNHLTMSIFAPLFSRSAPGTTARVARAFCGVPLDIDAATSLLHTSKDCDRETVSRFTMGLNERTNGGSVGLAVELLPERLFGPSVSDLT